MTLGRISSIGFDFDKTLANINSLHNTAWLSLLADLSIHTSKKEFFVWPVSKLEKYDSPMTILNCLFRNENLRQIFVLDVVERITKLPVEYPVSAEHITSEYECARALCFLKEAYLQRMIQSLSADEADSYLYPNVKQFLLFIRQQKQDIFYFIASSSSGKMIRSFLEKTDLQNNFDFVIGEEDIGYVEKIEPRAASQALNVMKSRSLASVAGTILYVGDDEMRDHLFSENMGAYYVQVHKRPMFLKKSFFANDFNELTKVINQIEQSTIIQEQFQTPVKQSETDRATLLSLSLLEQEKTRSVLDISSMNVDMLHADFSDGSSMPGWECDCTQSVSYWGKIRPSVPVDLHFYSNSDRYIAEKLHKLSTIHPTIRTVFIHVENTENLKVLELVSSKQYVVAPSLHYATSHSLLHELHILKRNPKEILVLLPKAQEPDEKYIAMVIPFLKELRGLFPEARLGVDRDVNASRLSSSAQMGVTHYVIGKALYNTPKPATFTSFLHTVHRYSTLV